jgi:hypothetical protein
MLLDASTVSPYGLPVRLVITVVAFVLYVALEHVPVGGVMVAIQEIKTQCIQS